MKNNDSFRIAGACAFGALIGSLVALEIAARFTYGSYLWIIGALIGGCVAYITIDFRHFCAGVSHSFRRTIAWRPDGLYWRAVGSVLVASAAFAPTMVCSYIILVLLGRIMPELLHMIVFLVLGTIAFVNFCFPVTLILFGIGELWRLRNESVVPTSRLNRIIESNRKMTCDFNPVSAAILAVRHILRALHDCVVCVPAAVAATCSFVKKVGKAIATFIAAVFVYVHSTRRTICFVDATIGALIGYYFGSAIVGSVVGAILGVVNYEVVSVRWLRLVPATR